LIHEAQAVLARSDIAARTIRYATPAVDNSGEIEGYLHSLVRWLHALAEDTGVRWYCVPLDLVDSEQRRERLAGALDLIGKFDQLFINLIVATERRISIPAIDDAATLITRVARKSANGLDNFRVGVSCCVAPNGPFFPYANFIGPDVAFSFALETTKIVNAEIGELGTDAPIERVRDQAVDVLTGLFASVDAIGNEIAAASGAAYCGLDGAFAPYPDDESSVGRLVEAILHGPAGRHGSVFVTGVLTDIIRAALRRSGARSCGFNGVMYSLLEDRGLADANNQRGLTLDGLVAMSAVCGCGVDMVPIPGASFPEEIAAVILDVAAMSVELDKPLGVRLLPIPNKAVNELTEFNQDFLCNSRVVALSANQQKMRTGAYTFTMIEPRNAPHRRCESDGES
jgi:uncharacterized protein (UPF0210 family)